MSGFFGLELLFKKKKRASVNASNDELIDKVEEKETDSEESDIREQSAENSVDEKENNLDKNTIDFRPLIENLKVSIGQALVSSSIVDFSEMQSVATYKQSPRCDGLIANYTINIKTTLEKTEFGKLGQYFAVALSNDKMMFVLPFERFCWIIIFDTNSLSIGTFSSIILPICIKEMNSITSKL